MTTAAKAKTSGNQSTHLPPVILFGIDSTGKPKAARFGAKHAGLATKAASQLQLQLLPANTPNVAEITARLPVGRVHATGRMFIPFVRRDVYDKLVLAASAGGSKQQPPAAPPSSTGGAAGSNPPRSAPNRPRRWRDIGVGDLVLAYGGPEEGWYEAIVMEAQGDMMTVRWPDYPRERRYMQHRNRLALLYPDTIVSAEANKSAETPASTKHDKPSAAKPSSSNSPQPLPIDWQTIDVGHLVVAKADGPWSSWWEAITIEKAGDGFKLRWRDGVNKSSISRPRTDLALICPDAA